MGLCGCVVLAVFSAARSSMSRTISFATAVVLHTLCESVGTKSLPNDPTAIIVEMIFVVLPASRSNTLLVVGRTAADLATRILAICLALVWCSVARQFRRVTTSTCEGFPIASPAIVPAVTVRARALARRACAGSWAAGVLPPCLPLIRRGLARHFGCKAACARESLSIAGPAVGSAVGSRAVTLVGSAGRDHTGTARVLVPSLALIGGAFASHLRVVVIGTSERFSVAGPAVFLAVGPRTGAFGWFTCCIILTTLRRGAEIAVRLNLGVGKARVRRYLYFVSAGT